MTRFRRKNESSPLPVLPQTADEVLAKQCRDALDELVARLADANRAGLDAHLYMEYDTSLLWGLGGRVDLQRLAVRLTKTL